MLGQFLAYLEIFSEGRMELLRLQSDLHNDLASLQNECIILGFKIEGPSPLEIFNASPSKAGAQSIGPRPKSTSGSWARHGRSFISLGLKFLGSRIDPRGTILE